MGRRTWRPAVLALLLVGLPARALAQQMTADQLPKGPLPMTSDQLPRMQVGSGVVEQPSAPQPAFSPIESSVGFIDSAIPRTQARLRFDLNYDDRRPTRAEFLYPKGGVFGARGMPLPESRVDAQDFTPYVEVAFTPRFGVFMEQPLRWVNPRVNDNEGGGPSDFNFGFKYAFVSESALVATFQFRLFVPIAQQHYMGTGHWMFEPATLVNYRITDFLTLEGECRWSFPAGAQDFAGDVLRYGLGLSYGQRSASEIWVTPVAEVIGWTVMSGQAQVVRPNGTFDIEDAGGTTIISAHLGVRLGLGDRADFFAGYGRALTGPAWYRDMARFEFRFFF